MNLPDAVPRTRRSLRPNRWLPPSTLAGVALAIVAVLSIAAFTFRSLETRSNAAERFRETLATTERIESLLAALASAESGQRGFLIASDEEYLRPFHESEAGLTPAFEGLRTALRENAVQLERLATTEQLIREKFGEMSETIRLQRAGDSIGARALVKTDRGAAIMQRIRATTADMKRDEAVQVAARQTAWRDAVDFSILWAWTGSGILIALILIAAYVMSREYRAREQLTWLRAARAEFGVRIQGEQALPQLGRTVLSFLAEHLDAQVGAVYIAESDGKYRRFAGHALADDARHEVLRAGEGILGQAAVDKRAVVVRDVPAGHLPVTSSVGESEPREILVAPAIAGGEALALVELGFLRNVHPVDEILVNGISEALAVAVRSSRDRTQLIELLEETQRQAEELQAQQEELRDSNEELDRQARSLRDSQARLEEQQAELEQTNTQLEDQAQVLESQKESLSRAQGVLSEKATELQRANQYKSEFLANMSHELRTPLNSALILAKLLSDNRKGNLDEEQVEFAQTIYSAGNDLLALINDIIDLSRIEAGRVRVDVEQVSLATLVEGLVRVHQPVARQKDLGFTASIAPNAPERIETDERRLGQILKNLLSNALKFTEEGEVSLRVESESPDRVSFVVRDTGIGVSDEQQQIIFEAFRQADGSMHRRYGGAGLGLSISRDLARLLGGDITVRSAPGAGSTFTLTIPRTTVARVEPRRDENADVVRAPARPPRRAAIGAEARAPAAIEIDDDRERLRPDSRRILVIEDDARFATILRDLARQMSFQCVVAHTATDGLLAAARMQPSAILLDVNLPDHSGLGVLDQLKRDPRTRHVPVHVVSVADYAKEALELGAVGYALKPVPRDELVEMFQGLERRLTRTLRRVLVVEDDERQRESIRHLLENDGVEIVGVATAGEAVIELRGGTFDCVVLDHNLPDLSGRDLLEQMSTQDDVSFPPVIVYTGRALKREEELQLRRYARSIIVKDARSPERLLDEVTLFLHQVESNLPPERQQMLKVVRDREALLEGRRILVVEDDVRNIFALSRVLEPKGATVEIARNGREAIEALARSSSPVDLVLMDIMMPEMDGLTAMREIRKRPEWARLPIIALTAKAMRDDQEACLAAGANDYIAKPLDVDKLMSLIRVWMPK